jgi:chromosome partitioning protein
MLVLNRVDRRTLEGQQLVEELVAFGDRAVFVRAFSTGFPISGRAGELAYGEIRSLTDLVERFLSSAPADVR